jgi:hypothetical protein
LILLTHSGSAKHVGRTLSMGKLTVQYVAVKYI